MAINRFSDSSVQEGFPKYTSLWDGRSAVGSMDSLGVVLLATSTADITFNNTYPGVIVDPSYAIFYNPCLSSFNDGKNPWLHLVDVSFNTTSYYNGAIKGDPLYNMSYPEKVLFSCNWNNKKLIYLINYYIVI